MNEIKIDKANLRGTHLKTKASTVIYWEIEEKQSKQSMKSSHTADNKARGGESNQSRQAISYQMRTKRCYEINTENKERFQAKFSPKKKQARDQALIDRNFRAPKKLGARGCKAFFRTWSLIGAEIRETARAQNGPVPAVK